MTPTTNQRWADERMPDAAWRPTAGLSAADRAREQDKAAGGHHRRLVRRADGSDVAASVFLRVLPRGRRCYAYLRYASGGRKTREVYLGEVHEASRAANLAAGWSLAHARDLTKLEGGDGPPASGLSPAAPE